MDIWQPDPGETLLARTPVTFATGAATRVKGMRWFRDTERHDIQSELPGWPEGPVYTPRSSGGSLARKVGKGGVIALGAVVMAALSAAGGNLSGSSAADAGKDSPDDPADEVDDFPVLWASPGTIARTLPWQLDPGRVNEKHYRTHAIVTDRRLVIVGLAFYEKDLERIEDEVLWEVPRPTICAVQPRDFKDGTDVQLTFTDGSWCRLSSLFRRQFTRYLASPLNLVPLGSLTQAQRIAVDNFLSTAVAPDLSEPFVTLRPCGHYRAEALVPSELNAFSGTNSRDLSMNADGTELEYTDYHPEDF
ncbi:hypothetical protein ACH4D5_16365 [Streptomyces sp. NPDC018029]|uniref:hypothetical protein n=1 Tax=Streptomyces sp. NPDC018029 TaxID=3365032 RepID=UPI0037A4428D